MFKSPSSRTTATNQISHCLTIFAAHGIRLGWNNRTLQLPQSSPRVKGLVGWGLDSNDGSDSRLGQKQECACHTLQFKVDLLLWQVCKWTASAIFFILVNVVDLEISQRETFFVWLDEGWRGWHEEKGTLLPEILKFEDPCLSERRRRARLARD